MIVPLHVHSYYSLLEGVISPDDIIDKAVSYNLDAIALTDTNAMHGLIPFYKKANEKGIKPILGTYIDEPSKKNPSPYQGEGLGVRLSILYSLQKILTDILIYVR